MPKPETAELHPASSEEDPVLALLFLLFAQEWRFAQPMPVQAPQREEWDLLVPLRVQLAVRA